MALFLEIFDELDRFYLIINDVTCFDARDCIYTQTFSDIAVSEHLLIFKSMLSFLERYSMFFIPTTLL